MTADRQYFEEEIQHSVQYLSSQEAIDSLQADAYWPKWNSPWWHMLLLHEIGETKRIPETAIKTHIATLNRMPLKIFPIQPGDMPEGINPYRECPCHCQLGNVYQVLAHWGIDVDKELPWVRPWLLRYQMDDGGLNCDNDAYLIKDETPSSMVGTIAAFESILLYTPKPWTTGVQNFIEKGAQFLIGRKLMLGSQTKHNAHERESAKDWLKPCFPRFYLYDVLRGLNALLSWEKITGQEIPYEAIREVVDHLNSRFPNEEIRNERLSYGGAKTFLPSTSGVGEWKWGESTTVFPLLQKVSAIGDSSPFLSKQWSKARAQLKDSNAVRCSPVISKGSSV